MSEGYALVERVPTITEYCDLRRLAGMGQRTPEAAARGLPGGLYAVVIEHDGKAVGMGRVTGDGGTAYTIVDIAVLPEHQRRGLGNRIVGAIMDWLRKTAPKSAYVCLIADGPAADLYARHGFRPTAPVSIGMGLTI